MATLVLLSLTWCQPTAAHKVPCTRKCPSGKVCAVALGDQGPEQICVDWHPSPRPTAAPHVLKSGEATRAD